MKQKYKKENSPRMQSAINQTFHAYVEDWFYRSNVRDLGTRCLDLAYGADKYDILSKLQKGFLKPLVSFIRGDIRHGMINAVTTQINVLIVLFILILTF